MIRILVEFIAALALLVGGGTLVALRGPNGILAVPAVWAAVPDAYGAVPGTFVVAELADSQLQPALLRLSAVITATVFGATCKLQGSNDARATINTGNWVDLTTEKADGTANIVDVVCPVGVPVALQVEADGGTTGASAGMNFRVYRVMAKNTVGGSVASVAVALFGPRRAAEPANQLTCRKRR